MPTIVVPISSPVAERDPSICYKASESHLTYLVFMRLVLRLLVFDIIVSIKVRGIIIKYVGCTLGHVTQTLLFQMINLLESFFSSELELAFCDDSMMSETLKVVFRDETGLVKAFAN
jgi:hypothetical protein